MHLEQKPVGYLGSALVGMAFAAGGRRASARCSAPSSGWRRPRATSPAGMLLLAVYSAGLAVPFLVAAVARRVVSRLVPAVPALPAVGHAGQRRRCSSFVGDPAGDRRVHPAGGVAPGSLTAGCSCVRRAALAQLRRLLTLLQLLLQLLPAQQLPVAPAAGEQLGVGALLHDPAPVQHQDPVGVAHRGQPVGHDDAGAALQRIAQAPRGSGPRCARPPRSGRRPARTPADPAPGRARSRLAASGRRRG